jgi:hypothetical protein
MLFSAGILLIFAASVIIYKCFPLLGSEGKWPQRLKAIAFECAKHCNIALIIILGTIAAMFLELTSMRSNYINSDTYFASVLSVGFLQRIGESAYNFFLLVRSINKYAFIIMMLVVAIAGVIYFRKKEKPSCRTVVLAKICLIAGPILFLFDVVLAAKAGPRYLGEIRCAYGPFFFLLLFIGLLSVYILQEREQARLFFPFILVVLLLVILNSRWPYQTFALGDKHALVRQFIPLFEEADRLDHKEIVLYLPKISPENWEIDWFSEMLYNHRVTLNKITVVEYIRSADQGVYYVVR